MASFTKEDLLRIAEISSLRLEESKVEWLQRQLAKTIAYTEQLEKVETVEEHDAVKTINVFREDKAEKKDSDKLLSQAPETKDTYFVVPKILE